MFFHQLIQIRQSRTEWDLTHKPLWGQPTLTAFIENTNILIWYTEIAPWKIAPLWKIAPCFNPNPNPNPGGYLLGVIFRG